MPEKVGILTSGGDSPGMNAALRSFVRVSLHHQIEIIGIEGGYEGLLDKNFTKLNPRSVGLIINQGGTFLKTSRSERFKSKTGLKQAAQVLTQYGIGSLCVVGGDGSFAGLQALSQYFSGRLVGIPGTIDNDIHGTEYTIGFATAVETAVSAIDKIRDTASSHNRLFLVEVMGKHSGQIAVAVALASGAEDVLVPEESTNINDLVARLEKSRNRGKRFGIVIVAEGDDAGGAFQLAERVQNATGLDIRVSILGHIQRGGNPVSEDRIWATRMGEAAFHFIREGKNLVFTAVDKGEIIPRDLKVAVQGVRKIDPKLVELIRVIGIQ